MKKILLVFAVLLLSTSVYASPYNFNGTWVDVEAWAGTGENETILVVDWNMIDQETGWNKFKLDANGTGILSQSHAFGYRWDGTVYESDMLTAFNDAGILTVTTGYGGAFIMNIGYLDAEDNEVHLHIEEGSWNLASTSDPEAYWGGLDWAGWSGAPSEWDFNTAGANEELLVDGQYEGINAIMYFDSLPAYADNQLDIPFASVPIPGAVWLIGSGFMAMIGIKRNKRK